jgi:hypothetical protein
MGLSARLLLDSLRAESLVDWHVAVTAAQFRQIGGKVAAEKKYVFHATTPITAATSANAAMVRQMIG